MYGERLAPACFLRGEANPSLQHQPYQQTCPFQPVWAWRAEDSLYPRSGPAAGDPRQPGPIGAISGRTGDRLGNTVNSRRLIDGHKKLKIGCSGHHGL